MAVRMTVSMTGAVARRHGGRSRFRVPVDYPSRVVAVAALRMTFHPGDPGWNGVSDDDYLEILRGVGIYTQFEEI
jgi:hypothetical protein